MATSDRIRGRIEELARQLVDEMGEVDEDDGDCCSDDRR